MSHASRASECFAQDDRLSGFGNLCTEAMIKGLSDTRPYEGNRNAIDRMRRNDSRRRGGYGPGRLFCFSTRFTVSAARQTQARNRGRLIAAPTTEDGTIHIAWATCAAHAQQKNTPSVDGVFFDKPDYSCFWALILTPGPMVEAVTQERMYWPFAAAGLALMMAPMSAA